jgi:hypothetical protein
VRGHDFINYDDDVYIQRNSHVSDGLSWQTVAWSFTTTEQANWHPVTWLSHALDCELFGLDAGYHHLTSAVIHAFNVLLLFLILWQATAALGRSFLVAALFACYPLNVESVAWASERKSASIQLIGFIKTKSTSGLSIGSVCRMSIYCRPAVV